MSPSLILLPPNWPLVGLQDAVPGANWPQAGSNGGVSVPEGAIGEDGVYIGEDTYIGES